MSPRSTVSILLLILASVPALAQDVSPPTPAPLVDDRPSQLEQVGLTPPTVMSEGHEITAGEVMVSTVLGQTVYAGVDAQAAVVGTVEDLVIGPLGEITAAIVDAGTFLNTGPKPVAVAFADLQRLPVGGELRWVFETTQEALAAAPVFEPPREEISARQVAENDTGASASDPSGADPSADTPAPSPADLIGMGVYGRNDQPIGTINSIVETPEGEIDALVIDVGGFLGLGAKPVAVAYEDLTFPTDSSGANYLFLNTTREALEVQPMYDPATYENNRAEQRMVVGP